VRFPADIRLISCINDPQQISEALTNHRCCKPPIAWEWCLTMYILYDQRPSEGARHHISKFLEEIARCSVSAANPRRHFRTWKGWNPKNLSYRQPQRAG
jgi:hypothetical protein